MRSPLIPRLAALISTVLLAQVGSAATNDWYSGMWRVAHIPHLQTKSVFIEKDPQGRIVMELRCFDSENSLLSQLRSTAHLVTLKGMEQLHATNFPGHNLSVHLNPHGRNGPSLGVGFLDGCANCNIRPGGGAGSGVLKLSGQSTPLGIGTTERHLANYSQLHRRWAATSRAELLKLATGGDWQAQYYLGGSAVSRSRRDSERADAYQWSHAAATNGVINAMANVALALANAIGTPPNTDQAHAWLHEAAKANATFPNRMLGQYHMNGWGVPVDPDKSVKYWKKANAAGDAQATRNLIHHYLVRTTNDCSSDLAGVLKNGIQHNRVPTTAYLRTLLESGFGRYRRTEGARAWLRAGAELGIGSMQTQLGRVLAAGVDGDADLVNAKRWFQAALDGGFAAAGAELGVLNEFRSPTPDIDQSAVAYRRGAKLGDNESMCRLAVLHLDGKHGDRKDALPWLSKAAGNGYGWAESLLQDHFPAEAKAIIADSKRNLSTPRALESELRRAGWLNQRTETQAQVPQAAQKLAAHFPLLEFERGADSTKWQKFTLNQKRVGFDGIRIRVPEQPGRYNITFGLAYPKITFYQIGRNIVPRIGTMKAFQSWVKITHEMATKDKVPWLQQFHGFDAHIQALNHGQLKPGQDYVIWFSIPKAEPIECHLAISVTPADPGE